MVGKAHGRPGGTRWTRPVPSRRPPRGLPDHATGATWHNRWQFRPLLPPLRDLVGLRQVDGMAPRVAVGDGANPARRHRDLPGGRGGLPTFAPALSEPVVTLRR